MVGLTKETLPGLRSRLAKHLILADGRSAFEYVCIDFPRLRIVTVISGGKLNEQYFMVDGERAPSPYHALLAHDHLPVLTREEVYFIVRVPCFYYDTERLIRQLSGLPVEEKPAHLVTEGDPRLPVYRALEGLHYKGKIEYEDGFVRRTKA